jgi:putative oxidoreductase
MQATKSRATAIWRRADTLSAQPLVRDLGLIAIRVALAWLFIFHGAQTLFGAFNGQGLHNASRFYANVAHLHPGEAFALLGGSVEFFGGIAIAFGLLSRIAALGLVVDMVMAMITVTFKNGVTPNVANITVGGGYEINVALAALAAALLLLGAGRFSLDAVIANRLRAAWNQQGPA